MKRLEKLADPAGLLQEIFANAPVGLQIYARDGHCVLVNGAHTTLFGGVPPPEYNIFEDSILLERGVVGLVRRAFAGEKIQIPTLWYDIRELRNLPPDTDISGGRRIAIETEMIPLRGTGGEVAHVLLVFHDRTVAEEAREASEAATRAAEQRAAQSAFLAEAGRLLGASLDVEVTLAQVARLATSALGDFCVIDLVVDGGELRRVAAAHADPAQQGVLDELRAYFQGGDRVPQPAARVIERRAPELLAEVDHEVAARHTTSAHHKDLVLRLGTRSLLCAPLALGDRALGAITLGYVGTRRYTAADLPLVEALASRAAVAIDNARLYRAAEEARAQAEAANRAKDEFLAILGHELRNPLAPIVTALELTNAREAPTKERAVIERQVTHLRRLVDDLLDVSRITRRTLELDRARIDIAGAITDGIELARPLLDGRRHRFALQVADGLIVDGDRVRLAQVVANLLTNAARYTDPGGDVVLTAGREDGDVVIRVRDTGAGIPAELLPHVFETFTRGHRSIDRAAGGLGLGLAIVRSLAELHGGRATATSAGAGSTFEVRIPAAEGAADPARAPASPPTVERRGKVVVVDDNVDAGELLCLALADHGYDCSSASDPFAALELVRREVPDVAVVDIGMPGMDGYELARRLRADPALLGLRLIALTGFGQPSDRARSEAAGFATHLVKPIDLGSMIAAVERLLASR